MGAYSYFLGSTSTHLAKRADCNDAMRPTVPPEMGSMRFLHPLGIEMTVQGLPTDTQLPGGLRHITVVAFQGLAHGNMREFLQV